MKQRLIIICIMLTTFWPASLWAQVPEGKVYIKNVKSGLWWGAANSWGTHASLIPHADFVTLAGIIENGAPTGKYTMETQVSDGGTRYYFGGEWMDKEPAALTIEQSGNFWTISKDGNFFGTTGNTLPNGTQDLGLSVDGESEDALWHFFTEDEMKVLLNEATATSPVDATFLIIDHTFGRNNRNVNCWEVSKDCTNKDLTGGNSNKHCAQSYHSVFTSISQTLNNVPNGIYAFTAQGFYRQDGEDNDNLPEFFINGETAQVPLKTGSENSMADACESFEAGLYKISPIYVEVTDNTIKVGIQNPHNSNLWVVWDNFELTYYGAELLAQAIAELKKEIERATVILGNASDDAQGYEDLKAAIETAKNTNPTTVEEAKAATEALKSIVRTFIFANFIDAFNTSFELCQAVSNDLLTAADALGIDYSETGWKLAKSSPWCNSAVFEYGGKVQLNKVKAPAIVLEGLGLKALGVTVGWEGQLYYQSVEPVTLPAGKYVLLAYAYNANKDAQQLASKLGFVPLQGDAILSENQSFTSGKWTVDFVTINLSKDTKGVFQVGGGAVNAGSSSHAKLFFDGLTLTDENGLATAQELAKKANEAIDAALEKNNMTSLISNASFDDDLTFQVDGKMKEAVSTDISLSDRSWAYVAEDSTLYARPKSTSSRNRPDGRKMDAVNGFIGRVQGWTIESNQEFPKCEWVFFGTVPYDLVEQSIPIADDGPGYLEVPQRPSAYSGEDNIGFAYLSAGWGGRAVYKQVVKLPCAVYRLEYWAVNINPNGTNGKNLSKVTCRKNTWADETGFTDTEWTLHTIEFTPTSEFTMEFGFESSGSSGSNPILCIDGIKLYKIDDADPIQLLRSDINDLIDECGELAGKSAGLDYIGLSEQISDYVMHLEEMLLIDTQAEMETAIKDANEQMRQFREAIDATAALDAYLNEMDELLNSTHYEGYEVLKATYEKILGYKTNNFEEGVNVAALVLGAVAEAKDAINAYSELGGSEKVYATFDNPTNTNTTWNAETRSFTWSTPVYNQLRNIGLPSGDISMFKKLVVDCKMVTGDRFRILFYKGGSSLTLYAKDGVNKFVLKDALEAVSPNDYYDYILQCDEICIAGDNVSAPGEAIINEVYLETFSINESLFANGTYYIYNTNAKKFLASGADWGTHAVVDEYGLDYTITFTMEGKYKLDSQVSNGGVQNYVNGNADDGPWNDGNSFGWTFAKTENDSYTISNGAKFLIAGENGVVTYTDNAAAADKWTLIKADDRFNELFATLEYANQDNGVDATFLIKSPNFNRNDLRNKAWVASKSGGNQTIGGPNEKRVAYGCESWNNTFDIHQTVENAPEGIYEFTLDGFGTNGTTFIYINNTEVPFVNTESAANFGDAVDRIAAGEFTGNTTGKVKVSGALEIGVKRIEQVGADWTVFDNARLTYFGPALNLVVEKPVISRGSGNSVVMNTATEGASIFYTLDGSVPTTESKPYTGPIILANNCTVNAIAVKEGFASSGVATFLVDWFQVAKVKIEPDGIKVKMSTATEGAEIHYTTDGTTPTAESTLYTELVGFDHDVTILAIGIKDKFNDSEVSEPYEYKIADITVASPQIIPDKEHNTVSIECTTFGATIFYTVNGDMPTMDSDTFTKAIELTHNCTVKALAVKEGYYNSSVSIFEVDWFQAEMPVMALDYSTGTLTITCSTAGSTIYYIIGGGATQEYIAPIELMDNSSVTVWASVEGNNDSEKNSIQPIPNGVMDDGTFRINGAVTAQELLFLRNVMGQQVEHLDMENAILTDGGLGDEVFAGMGLLTVRLPKNMTTVGERLFSGCRRLAAVVWRAGTGPAPTPAMLEGIGNPNLLLYVDSEEAGRNSGVTNYVVNQFAGTITLCDVDADALSDGNFFCPIPFTANKISYSHVYTQQSGVDGKCQGWETIALPFDVTSIAHRVKGTIAPFGSPLLGGGDGGGVPHFWLYGLGGNRFEVATQIDANKPYIISMPQHEAFAAQYCLGGDTITFSATNAVVPVTAPQTSTAYTKTLHANFTSKAASDTIYTINIGEAYDDSHPEGSIFLPGRRTVRPFEAYTTTTEAGVRFIGIFDDQANGVYNLPMFKEQLRSGESYDLNGRRIRDDYKRQLPHRRLIITDGKVKAAK